MSFDQGSRLRGAGGLLRVLLVLLLVPVLARAAGLEATVRQGSEANPKLDVRLSGAVPAAVAGIVSHGGQQVDAAGRVLVLVYTTPNLSAAALATLTGLGLEVTHVSAGAGMVEGWIAGGALPELSAQGFVRFVTTPRPAKFHADETVSQGVAILQANKLQALGITGKGATVGVMSDGVTGLEAAKQSGNVGSVDVVSNTCVPAVANSGECAEGTAMLEIVHDMAPEAKLAFCGVSTLLSAQTCLDSLAEGGANVVVDDVYFDDESIFEDSTFSTDINTRAAGGLLYVSAAGNSHACNYDADYVPTASGAAPYDSYQDFGVSAGGASSRFNEVQLLPGGTLQVTLQWNDAWATAADDYDLLLEDTSGNVLASSTNVQNGSGAPPLEFIDVSNQGTATATVAVVVARHAGALGKHIHLKFSDGGSGCNGVAPVQYRTLANEVTGHPASTGAVAVGAIDSSNEADPQHLLIESYSSWGPSRYDFPSLSYHAKPDITGIDDVSVSGAGGFGQNGGCGGPECFYGTSAAAPHVAGILALLESRFSGNYVKALTASATSDGSVDAYGAGRANAFAAAGMLSTPPVATISAPASGETYVIGKPVTLAGKCADAEKLATTPAWSIPALDLSYAKATESGLRVFTAPGTYTVNFTCTDGLGGVGSSSATISVIEANPLTLTGSGTLKAPKAGGHDYKLVNINASAFTLGGTITITIPLGTGVSTGSYDLFAGSAVVPKSGTPTDSLANAYNVAPGTTTTLTYAFGPGTANKFKLGLEGGSSSLAGSSNTYSYTIKVTPVPPTLTLTGSGTLVAPGDGYHDYVFVPVDASAFVAGGTMTMAIQLGNGVSAASYDLFNYNFTPVTSGRPVDSLANAYDQPPGTLSTITYTFGPGTANKFKLGFEGNWFSPAGSTNTYTYTITVKSP